MAIKIKPPKSLNRTAQQASGIRPAGRTIGSNSANPQITNPRTSSPTKLSNAEIEMLLSSKKAALLNNPEQRADYQKSQAESLRPVNERFLSSAGREIRQNEEEQSADEIDGSAILTDQTAIPTMNLRSPSEELPEEAEETEDLENNPEAGDEAGQEMAMSGNKAKSSATQKPGLNQLAETGGEAAKEAGKQIIKKGLKFLVKKIWFWIIAILSPFSPIGFFIWLSVIFLMICFPIVMAYQCLEQKGVLGLAGSSLWNGFEKTLTDAVTGQCIADTSANTIKDDTTTAQTPTQSSAATESQSSGN